MLKELLLKNFKSFREETVRFSPSGLTVLVGPNGSGKSSVLEALFYSAFSYVPRALPALPGEGLVRAGSTGFELSLTIAASTTATASIESRFDGKRRSETVWAEDPGHWRNVKWDDTHRFAPEPEPPASVDLNQVYGKIPFPRFFDVDLKRLREPLRPSKLDVAIFGEEQVVQALFDLKMGADTDALARLFMKLIRIVPSVRGLSIRREPEVTVDRYRLVFNMTSGNNLDASQVSEGTLLALSILAAAERKDGPTLLLIDDIDRALHPIAQRELIRLLRAMISEGNLEIVCTTHSPYILSEFKYDEVRVVRDVDGESRCVSLSDGPEAARWMKELDAGEYWSFMEQKFFQKSA